MLSMMSQKMVAWVSYKSVVPLRSTSHFSGRLDRRALCGTALASSFLYYNTKPTFLQVGEKAFFREPFWTIPQKTGCRSIFPATAGFRTVPHKERLATLCGTALEIIQYYSGRVPVLTSAGMLSISGFASRCSFLATSGLWLI